MDAFRDRLAISWLGIGWNGGVALVLWDKVDRVVLWDRVVPLILAGLIIPGRHNSLVGITPQRQSSWLLINWLEVRVLPGSPLHNRTTVRFLFPRSQTS